MRSLDSTELLTLYDITSFAESTSLPELFQEVVEKAARLLGTQRIAFSVGIGESLRFEETWGFHSTDQVAEHIAQKSARSFFHSLEIGENSFLYLEQCQELTNRDQRLYTIFAETVEDIVRQIAMEAQLKHSEQEKTSILNSLSEAVILQDLEGKIRWANRAAERTMGTPLHELIGRYCYQAFYRRESPCPNCPVRRTVTAGIRHEGYIASPDGRHFFLKGHPLREDGGELTGVVMGLIDVTEQRVAEESLRKSEEKYRNILTTMQEGYLEIDLSGAIKFTNHAAQQMLGYSPEELSGMTLHQIAVSPAHVDDTLHWVQKNNLPTSGSVLKIRQSDQSVRYLETSIAPISDGDQRVAGFSAVMRDITDRKRDEERLRYLSLYDQLTGLYNRRYFEEQLVLLETKQAYPVTIMVLDLDGLKLINDTMGHPMGDELLKSCTRILLKCLRRSDTVARLGGDEFGVILEKCDKASGELLLVRIREEITSHNRENPRLPLSISIGLACTDEHGESLQEVYRKADDLMLRDKLYHSASSKGDLVNTLMITLAERDFMAHNHAERLEMFCLRIADQIELSSMAQTNLVLLAKVHDVGKVGIPDAILHKPGRLTPDEWEVMKQHSEKGYRIACASPQLAPIASLIRCHHEHWNGQGYPLGLKGNEIPIECRILAIADALDAMTGERPYRESMSLQEALAELQRCAGTQFDPDLVETAIKVLGEAH